MSPGGPWPTPDGIVDYYEASKDALGRLEAAARVGRVRRFVGLTTGEIDERMRAMRAELEREVSLALLASAEALLRVDFSERLRRRIKEPRDVRQRFKELAARDGDRVGLEDILHVWKEKVGHPDRFAAFFEYLRVRHWLAHGRYWELKTARRAYPEDVFAVIDELFSVLPGFRYP